MKWQTKYPRAHCLLERVIAGPPAGDSAVVATEPVRQWDMFMGLFQEIDVIDSRPAHGPARGILEKFYNAKIFEPMGPSDCGRVRGGVPQSVW